MDINLPFVAKKSHKQKEPADIFCAAGSIPINKL